MRNVERLKYLSIAAIMAVLTTVGAVVLTEWRALRPSFVIVLGSGYVVAVLTVFPRPVTGSIERSVTIGKAVFAVLGAGLIGAAAAELLAVGAVTGMPVIGAFMALLGAAFLALVFSDRLWDGYRERCYRAVERYTEMQRDADAE